MQQSSYIVDIKGTCPSVLPWVRASVSTIALYAVWKNPALVIC